MAPMSRSDIVDIFQLLWNNGTESLERANVTSLIKIDIMDVTSHFKYANFIVIVIVITLTYLCGTVGNGTVVWLLGFRLKRSPYSVYILNLAVADFIYILTDVCHVMAVYVIRSAFLLLFAIMISMLSHPVGLCLLMAISSERCVSVLWPIWYKCHRPAHLSTIVCAVIWALFIILTLLTFVCEYFKFDEWYTLWLSSNTLSLLTLAVLFVSGLILVTWGRCCSRQRQPGKLYVTILLNVLAVLLLSVPRGVFVVCNWQHLDYTEQFLIVDFLCTVNSAVNPLIYFFVGRHGQQRGRKPLREVLQSALTDEEAGTEQRRGITVPGQHTMTPEHQGGALLSARV